MDNQFDDEYLYDYPDPTKYYYCTPNLEATGFNILMKWVLLTRKYPTLLSVISDYIDTNPEEIDAINDYEMTALMIATANSRSHSTVETVQLLIEKGAILDIRNYANWSAVMYACAYSSTYSTPKTSEVLINAGASLDFTIDGKNILDITMRFQGCLEVIFDLLSKKYNMNDIYKSYTNALRSGHINPILNKDIFNKLLENNFNSTYCTDNGDYLIFSLIKHNHINEDNIDNILLDADIEVNICDDTGKTLLMHAINFKSFNLVKKLLGSGANVHDRDDIGQTAILYASSANLLIFNILLEAGANILDKDNENRTALMFCAYDGPLEVLEIIINKGVDVNAVNISQQSALMYAATCRREDVVQILINAGADIHHKNNIGESILMYAITKQMINLVEQLINMGANIFEVNNNKDSVLTYAIDTKNPKLVMILIKNKVDVNQRYGKSMVPLMRSKNPEITKILLDAGADVNAIDDNGNTVLISYVKENSYQSIKLIIDNRPDVNSQNSYGMTALMCAIERGDCDIISLIMDTNPCVTIKNRYGKNILNYVFGSHNPIKAQILHKILYQFGISAYDYPDDNKMKHVCSICHEDDSGQDVIKLKYCTHLFHKECIDGWIGNNSCPLCREKIVDIPIPDINSIH